MSIFQLLGGFFWAWVVLLVLPATLVLLSKRSTGGAKWGWCLLTCFFGWIAFAVFLIATQRPAGTDIRA